jgi:hypothetical protein
MHIVDIKLKVNFLSTSVFCGDQFYIEFLRNFPVDVSLSHDASEEAPEGRQYIWDVISLLSCITVYWRFYYALHRCQLCIEFRDVFFSDSNSVLNF